MAVADPDLVSVFEQLTRSMNLEVTKGVTAAGGDRAAAMREIKKKRQRLLEAFAKFAALCTVKAKWWNLTAKTVLKIVGVEIMPKANESLRHFEPIRNLFKNHAVAVRNVDDNSYSISFDGAYLLGWKAGFPVYWNLVEEGMDRKERLAESGRRRRAPDYGVNADARIVNRGQTNSHSCSSMQMDNLTIYGMPRVRNAELLMFMNRSDHRYNLEAHAGGKKAFIRDTDIKVGGDLEVPFKEVSFKKPFPESSTAKKQRLWTARASLDWLRVNGFIRGNWGANDGSEPLPSRVLGVLRRHDRLARKVVGRGLRITQFGTTRAGGLVAGPEDPDELPWDADAVATMFGSAQWITGRVLVAIMDTAQEAYERMVQPLVHNAIRDSTESEVNWVEFEYSVNGGASLPLVEGVLACGSVVVFSIDGDACGLLTGDVVTHVGFDEITSLEILRATLNAVAGAVPIRGHRVLDDAAREKLRLSIADASPGSLSVDKVLF